ncbi:hypothetical protein [Streptomyces sp. NPDC056632]|uniref:hypothetical protein n=1 Tax=Streptomyces sp. NPDC056632 TaxID=3345884 RepID=UPI00368AA39A
MESQEQTRRPDLFGAVAAELEAKRQAAEQATAPERDARERQAAADAALYGSAGWDALSDDRRRLAAAYAIRQAEEGRADAA